MSNKLTRSLLNKLILEVLNESEQYIPTTKDRAEFKEGFKKIEAILELLEMDRKDFYEAMQSLRPGSVGYYLRTSRFLHDERILNYFLRNSGLEEDKLENIAKKLRMQKAFANDRVFDKFIRQKKIIEDLNSELARLKDIVDANLTTHGLTKEEILTLADHYAQSKIEKNYTSAEFDQLKEKNQGDAKQIGNVAARIKRITEIEPELSTAKKNLPGAAQNSLGKNLLF
jgi:hypothetical protein